ncbi:fluoride efflux transporter CrcB [Litorilinea aerophila]|uniref:Fluoride-specific ion channel FluC n=1 Tax=Litorilinea aerophila TaxID=1204385 RepID=A0A540VJN4_9CHLR|nr:fluoride efflux transporter CrcB [Litorilinea aerophila]MCC9075406.1 fluoride efflux transporter CrcB [Litorilinea aerophila]OUC09331.1 camphor resistance protein CrcB [Litorilinea aerophila]GIV78631.1 MAG: putative fluoride ion transporter CrcB [Litorilinea sp.]
MNRFIWIGLGAILGANARYLVGVWAGSRFGADFPYGTLLVNITGSLLLGFLVTLSAGRLQLSPELRLFLAVGFFGSYTTFSSFAVESIFLFQDGGLGRGIFNILGNNLIGLMGALLGVYLARALG